LGSLTRDILPTLGAKQINDVTAQMVLAELRKVEARGAIETAHAIRGRLSKVFAFAIGEGVAELNPAEMIRQAMKPIPKGGHRPAADTLEGARKVMTATESIPAYPLTRLALRFLALTAVRPVEVSSAEWTEIDGALWRIPGWRMKMKREHLVPLSRQAMDVLEAARPFSHRTPFIFVSATSVRKPLSENALNVMLRRAGMQGVHVPHGWRASFSTLMNERFPADRLIIDLMLAHAAKGEVEAAYNRAEHLDRRRELIQIWADLLMAGMPAARSIIALPRKSV
jgi:integrase